MKKRILGTAITAIALGAGSAFADCESQLEQVEATLEDAQNISEPREDRIENLIERAQQELEANGEGACLAMIVAINRELRDEGFEEVRQTEKEARLAEAAEIDLPASRVEVEAPAAKVNVQSEPAQVAVQQKSPDIDVKMKQPRIEVEQPKPRVVVNQPDPEVTVSQPDPKVTVQQTKPNVTVQQAEPKVAVTQPEARVEVRQPEPTVEIQQPEPRVAVNQPEPRVSVEQRAPQVEVSQAEPRVEVKEQAAAEVWMEKEATEAKAKTAKASSHEQDQALAQAEEEIETVGTAFDFDGDTDLLEYTVADVTDMEVVGRDGEVLGSVERVAVEDADQEIHLAVGMGGFLELGETQYVIPLDKFTIYNESTLQLDMIAEDFEGGHPSYDERYFTDIGNDELLRERLAARD